MDSSAMILLFGNVFFVFSLFYLIFIRKSEKPDIVFKSSLNLFKLGIGSVIIGFFGTYYLSTQIRFMKNPYQLFLLISFWLLFLVFLAYTETKQKVIAKDGVGSVDFRGSSLADFFEWKKVDRYIVEDKRVVFFIRHKKGIMKYYLKYKNKEKDKLMSAIDICFRKKGKK